MFEAKYTFNSTIDKDSNVIILGENIDEDVIIAADLNKNLEKGIKMIENSYAMVIRDKINGEIQTPLFNVLMNDGSLLSNTWFTLVDLMPFAIDQQTTKDGEEFNVFKVYYDNKERVHLNFITNKGRMVLGGKKGSDLSTWASSMALYSIPDASFILAREVFDEKTNKRNGKVVYNILNSDGSLKYGDGMSSNDVWSETIFSDEEKKQLIV